VRIDLGTLTGIVAAQKRIQKVVPVDSAKHGMLQALENRFLELSRDEVRELMDALISLQNHCRSLEISSLEVEGRS